MASKVLSKKKAVKKAAKKTKLRSKPKLTKAELAVKKLNKEIAKREAVFKKASAAKKRVLIAQDVIAQIKAGRLKPATGSFVTVTKVAGLFDSEHSFTGDLSTDLIYEYDEKTEARDLLLNNTIKQCSCCALGGLFLGCTLYNNNTNLTQFAHASADISDYLTHFGGDTISNGLTKIFSESQLRLIEQTFEGDEGIVQSDLCDDDGIAFPKYSDASAQFYKTYPNPKSRLIAIMKNIIKNNGTFRP